MPSTGLWPLPSARGTWTWRCKRSLLVPTSIPITVGEDCLEKDLRAIELAEQVDQPDAEQHARFELANVFYDLGNPDEAAAHAAALLTSAEGRGTRFRLAQALAINTALCSIKGDWRAARDYSDRGLAVSPQEPYLLSSRTALEYEVGNFAKGRLTWTGYSRRLARQVLALQWYRIRSRR